MEVFETIGMIICGLMLYVVITILTGDIMAALSGDVDDCTGWGPWIAGGVMFAVVFVWLWR